MSTGEKGGSKYSINQPNATIGKQDIGDKTNPHYEEAITVESNYVQQLEKSLSDFINIIEDEAQKENIPSTEVTTFKTEVAKLEDATKDLSQGVTEQKKKTIHERLKSVAMGLVKMSPNIARTIIGFTPLAPFSNLIGETFDNMVNSAMNK